MERTTSFGYWVRRQRKALDLTQAALAQQVGCASVTIRKIEADERRPSRETAERLAEVLLIPEAERPRFLQAARAERSPEHLLLPTRPVEGEDGGHLRAAARLADSHLPTPLTPLVGREQELAILAAQMRREEVHLLTLTGPGGTGKTRLALQLAHTERATFADGVCFVDLAPLQDAALVATTIARALGVHEYAGQTLLASLCEVLRHRHLLLLLDNFEHLLEAAPVVATLLREAPQLKVLVTSREPLHLYSEREFPVPPLSLPDSSSPADWMVAVAGSEAGTLFVQRAQAIQSDFRLHEGNATTIAQLCARLDGLPLAIELAAARLKLFPVQTLLERIEGAEGRGVLPWLSHGARDLPARQQTLRRTIDWSFQLLSAAERQLFARMSVFAGGCTLDAALAVAGEAPLPRPSPRHAATDPVLFEGLLDTLTSLLDKSLVRTRAGDEGERRFGMLETIREYASTRLSETGEMAQVQDRHLAFFLHLAEAAEPGLRGPEQVRWLQRLDAEHDNLRAALAWSLRPSGPPEIALRLAGALFQYWQARGHTTEGRRWLALALAHVVNTATALRAKALFAAGILALDQGDTADARSHLEASVALCRALRDWHHLAYALMWLTELTRDRQAALPLEEEATALFREMGDDWGLAHLLFRRGTDAGWHNDLITAQAKCEESLALFHKCGDHWAACHPLAALGGLAFRRGDYREAQARYEESLAICEAVGDQPGIANRLNMLATLARAEGDRGRARAAYEESLHRYRELGHLEGIAWALHGLGTLARAEGALSRSATLLAESLDLLRKLENERGVAWLRQELGYVALGQKHTHRAAVCFGTSLSLSQERRYPVTAAFCLPGLAQVAALVGEDEMAARLAGAAEALRQTVVARLGSVYDQREYATHLVATSALVSQKVFSEAWAEAQNMVPEEVLHLASVASRALEGCTIVRAAPPAAG